MISLRNFLWNKAGNYAMTAAILSVPLMGAAGLAVDVIRGNQMRSEIQNAADAAALAAAKAGKSGSKYLAAANDAFDANLAPIPTIDIVSSVATIDSSGGTDEFVYTVDYVGQTSIMGLFGVGSARGQVVARAAGGANETEIVLVLDSTGSMASAGKMTELKKAVRLFADEFEGLQAKVKIAVVPFDTQVRLDNVSFGNAAIEAPANPFTDGTDCATLPDPADQQYCYDYKNAAAAATGCNSSTVYYLHYSQTTQVCVTVSNGTKYVETTVTTYPDIGSPTVDVANTTEPFEWGPKTTKPNDIITSNNDLLGVTAATWTGCVIDRQQPNDVTGMSPSPSDPTTLYPAAYCSRDGLQPIVPLTNDLNKIRNLANALQPSGNTNITIGLQWGLEALTKAQPLNGASGKPEVNRYMILLTDGVNTQNRWTYNSGDIDSRARLACNSVKADKIELYTVRLIDGNAALLSDCATKPSMFFDVQNATELSDVFRDLAQRIKKLRLVG